MDVADDARRHNGDVSDVSMLFPFHGGVKTQRHKTESTQRPLQTGVIPARLIVPLLQHAGAPAKPLVQPGDRVLKGQCIGQADGWMSAAVHAPTSGHVIAVDQQPVPHPSGLPDVCVTIDPDGADEWIAPTPLDYRGLPPDALRDAIRTAGVVGLGGAVFPSAEKMRTRGMPLEHLIINGAECEPWMTCDDVLMRERAAGIVAGIHILVHVFSPREVLIGIEDDKPEAIAAMTVACAGTGYLVRAVPTCYPSGGAKQLTKLLTNKEAPVNGRSTDIGVQCFNVATAYTLHRALDCGEPVISRIVTVTGAVQQPANIDALIGTPVADLITQCGGYHGVIDRLIMGGPMMGVALHDDTVPVVKAMNCVLAMNVTPAPTQPELPCIRCGDCVDVCPANLLPQQLYWFARADTFEKAKAHALFSCIECGCCSYVCPSHIPLVQYYRYAKDAIRQQHHEKMAADRARQRYRDRLARLARDKREREEKLRQKAPPRVQDE